MITVNKYNTLDKKVLQEIEKLHVNSKIPKIDITPYFYECFHKYIQGKWKSLFLIIYEGDDCIGVVPLMYLDFKRKGIFPYRLIRFYGSISSDFSDIFTQENKRSLVIKEALSWLYSGRIRWEEMILDDLLDETELIKPINEFLKRQKAYFTHRIGKYFYINLDTGWDEVKLAMSKKFVFKNVNLATNRISKDGAWYIVYNPDINANEVINNVKSIHISRQSVLNRPSRFANENDLIFFNKIIDYFSKRQQFQTYWLYMDNKIIAYMLGFYLDNTFYWWNTAFDPDYEKYYPTRLLQFKVIEYMHRNNYKEFNFLRGESGYKEKWTKSTRNNHKFVIRNNKTIYGKVLLKLDKIFKKK